MILNDLHISAKYSFPYLSQQISAKKHLQLPSHLSLTKKLTTGY
jgi:hypothetical protein